MSDIRTGDAVEFGSDQTGIVESMRTKRIRGVQTRQFFVRSDDGSLHMALTVRKILSDSTCKVSERQAY